MIDTNIKFAWKKDKFDPKDYTHAKVGFLTEVIPDSINLEQYCPEVRNQGSLGSCTGHAFGGILSALALKLGVFTEWFSPTWIYNGARFIEGTLQEDSGAYPSNCCKWIKSMGCLLEHDWPYNPTVLDIAPPTTDESDEAEAKKYPIVTYIRVTGGSNGIMNALASGNMVAIGTPWFEEWSDIGSTGILPAITDKSIPMGGHETFLYGYDKVKQVFYGQNSWGADWGRRGRYTMPMSAFTMFRAFGGYDAHYVTVNWTGAPKAVEKDSVWKKFLRKIFFGF